MRYNRFILLVFLIPFVVFSQPEDYGVPPDEPPPLPPDWSEKIYTVLVAQMTKVLDIRPEQASVFFPTFNQFYKDYTSLKKEERDVMIRLRRLGSPQSKSTSVDVDKALKSFHSLQEKKMKSMEKFFDFSLKSLDPWQTARLHPFMHRFNERLEESIRERMREDRPRRHRGGN